MSLQLRCDSCHATEDNDPEVFCSDCWKKQGEQIRALEERIEEQNGEIDDLNAQVEDLTEKLELEANVYAEEIAKWRERVRLLLERFGVTAA